MHPPTRSQNSSPINRTKQPSGFESHSSLNHFVKKIPGNLSSSPATNSPTTLKNRSSRKFKLHLANSSGIRGPADPSLMLTTPFTGPRRMMSHFKTARPAAPCATACSPFSTLACTCQIRYRQETRVDLYRISLHSTQAQPRSRH